MPLPFPGMDPFLEQPGIFPDLHNGLIFCLQEDLQRKLPDPYFAATGQREWIEIGQRFIGPDVHVHPAAQEPVARPGAGGAALAVLSPTQPVVIHVPREERRETYLNIYKGKTNQLVTALEILSSNNKARTGPGRKLYLQKQQELLDLPTHLVEFDLLRGGRHTTAVPLKRLRKQARDLDYHICCSRFDRREDFLIYPIRLTERLARLKTSWTSTSNSPSSGNNGTAMTGNDAGPYRRQADYLHTKVVSRLQPDQAEWVQKPSVGSRAAGPRRPLPAVLFHW